MCIIGVAVGCSDRYPLVCVHNREEAADRPTTRCARRGDVVCATDALAGGTWMGINVLSGLFCSLTNLRSRRSRLAAASRGLLVRELLGTHASAALAKELRCASARSLAAAGERLRAATAARPFEGLNLCVGAWHPTPDGRPPAAFYVANVPPHTEGGEWRVALQELQQGRVHAWSNGAPGAPVWPKSSWLQWGLAQVIAEGGEIAAAGSVHTGGLRVVAAHPSGEEEAPAGSPLRSMPPPDTVRLLRRLCGLLSTTNEVGPEQMPVDMRDSSSHEAWQEQHLQRGAEPCSRQTAADRQPAPPWHPRPLSTNSPVLRSLCEKPRGLAELRRDPVADHCRR
jgi:hypothetical protein